MSGQHWMARCEYVSDGNPRILGEDEWGLLWVPSRDKSEYWDRVFNSHNPLHWGYWLRSRLTKRIAFLEQDFRHGPRYE